MWKDGAGDTHSVHLVARKGEEALRTADSFLGSITVDGEEQAKPLAVSAGYRCASGVPECTKHHALQQCMGSEARAVRHSTAQYGQNSTAQYSQSLTSQYDQSCPQCL